MCGGATVRTVRIVRARAELQSCERFRGARPADGSSDADGRGKDAGPTVRESASKAGAEDAVDVDFDLMPGAEVEL